MKKNSTMSEESKEKIRYTRSLDKLKIIKLEEDNKKLWEICKNQKDKIKELESKI